MSLELHTLAQQRVEAKANEDAAVAARRAIDARIAELLGKLEEGTLKTDVGLLRVSVSYSLTRKVSNQADLQQAWGSMSELQRTAFRWKPEVDVRALKAMESTHPAAAAPLSVFITSTPASPTVKVEQLVVNSPAGA